MKKQNNNSVNPLGFVDECFAEMNTHTSKVRFSVAEDIRACFELLKY